MGYLEFEVDISPKAKVLQEAAREFGMEVMRPAGIELDKLSDPADVMAEGSVLWDVFKKYRELGFHKMMIPRAYGGSAGKAPAIAQTLIGEQLGYADSGLAISLGAASMPFAMAILSPDAEVRDLARQYAEDTEADMVGCWAITEPDHGSDWVMGTTKAGDNPKLGPGTRAVKKGDEYIVNGWKAAWVSNGTIATHAVLHVGIDQSRGMHGSGIALCPLDLPGISRGKPLNKIGQRPLNQGEILFEDVKLHKKYMLLSTPGVFGSNVFGKVFLGTANSFMGVTFAGLAQAVLDEAIKFAKETDYCGAPLIEQERIRLKLFYMFAMVESARLFARKVVNYRNAKKPSPVAKGISAMVTSSKATFWTISNAIQLLQKLYVKYGDRERVRSFIEKIAQSDGSKTQMDWGMYGIASKVLATETAFNVAGEAMQIFGEKGISTEYPVEKMLRDARAAMIEDGANEALALAASEGL